MHDKSTLIIWGTRLFIIVYDHCLWLEKWKLFLVLFFFYLPLDWPLLTIDKWRSFASKHIQLRSSLHRPISTTCIYLYYLIFVRELLYCMMIFVDIHLIEWLIVVKCRAIFSLFDFYYIHNRFVNLLCILIWTFVTCVHSIGSPFISNCWRSMQGVPWSNQRIDRPQTGKNTIRHCLGCK